MRGGWLVGVLVVATVCGACGRDPPSDVLDLVVTSAGLSNPEVTGGGVAMGGMRVTADLDVTDASGGQHLFAVVLSGPCLGTTGVWSSELNANDDSELLGVGLDLPERVPSDVAGDAGFAPVTDAGSDRALRIRHLFLDYSALGFGMHAMLGAAVYYFSNDADVTIWLGGLTPGMGVTWGAGSLRMAVLE